MTVKDITKTPDAPKSSYGDTYSKTTDIRYTRLYNISTADDNINITEPSSPYHAEYPYCESKETLSGHVIEHDDTPGAERIFEMHKSGTFYEIHPDGTRVLRVYGDNFEIALSDNNLVVGGDLNITVQGNANILTKGNVKQKVGGDYSLTVAGNMTTRVKGTRLDYTKGNQTMQTAGNFSLRNEGAFDHYSKGTYLLSVETTFNTVSKGKTSITSNSKIYVDGSEVHFNLPGPSVPFNVVADIDPTGGLTIEDSVMEPNSDIIKTKSTSNDILLNMINNTTTYPKDRKQDD